MLAWALSPDDSSGQQLETGKVWKSGWQVRWWLRSVWTTGQLYMFGNRSPGLLVLIVDFSHNWPLQRISWSFSFLSLWSSEPDLSIPENLSLEKTHCGRQIAICSTFAAIATYHIKSFMRNFSMQEQHTCSSATLTQWLFWSYYRRSCQRSMDYVLW